MISKGEECMAKAVRSALPAVTEIVIVDTSLGGDAVRSTLADPIAGIDLDADSITLDGRVIALRIVHDPWVDDFSRPREIAKKALSQDWFLWLDSDDTLVGAEILAEWWAKQPDHPCEYAMLYNYEFDEKGQPETCQQRERIVNRRLGVWEPEIHEVFCRFGNDIPVEGVPTEIRVDHDLVRGSDKHRESTERNARMMEAHIRRRQESGQQPDRRLVLHYGIALGACRQHERAIDVFKQLLPGEPRGWLTSRILCFMAENAAAIGKTTDCQRFAAMAHVEARENISPYSILFDCALRENRWEDAIHWFESGYLSKRQTDAVWWLPKNLVPPYHNAALAACFAGRMDKSIEWAKASGEADLLRDMQAEKTYKEHVEDAQRWIEHYKLEGKDRRAFVEMLPERIRSDARISRLAPPEIPDDKLAVTIHCGMEGMGCGKDFDWGPDSLKDGIGGSEEAVIRIAPLLVKEGLHVEVYGPWRDQVREGVHWRNYHVLDTARRQDAFIAWRYSNLLTRAPLSAKTFLWCHDIVAPNSIAPMPDEVWCLSDYHKDQCLGVYPDAHVWKTANGIPNVAHLFTTEKEAGRAFYASSPDRGLLTLLGYWPRIREKVPYATLHLYYGYNAMWMQHEAQDPAKRQIRLAVEALCDGMKDEGVVWHGRVGQDELHLDVAKSIAWLYPTDFNEISCITAMKAQALGVWPVCSRFAALDETVSVGSKFGSEAIPNVREFGDAFVEEAIRVLSAPPVGGFARRMHEKFQWSKVAASWAAHLREVCRGDFGVGDVGEASARDAVCRTELAGVGH